MSAEEGGSGMGGQYNAPGGSGSVTPETFSCPKCGHSLAVGTPICGNCGSILQGGSHVPAPLAAGGIRPGAVIMFALAVAVAVAGFLGRDTIADWVDSLTDTSSGSGAGPGGPDVGVPDIDIPDIDIPDIDGGGGRRVEGPRNIGQVVRAIRAAGIPCTAMDVQAVDDFVASGSCQSQGRHLQINLYFRPETMAFAREFYSDWAFATAHRDNWWISGETTLVRTIAQALDARFRPPS